MCLLNAGDERQPPKSLRTFHLTHELARVLAAESPEYFRLLMLPGLGRTMAGSHLLRGTSYWRFDHV
jgi:hypothetical protein